MRTNRVHQRRRDRAVVIGASIGGLLAARVLADDFREVVVVDRDRFGPFGEYRKGVQQARHAHGLLAGGQRAMEELLPGLTGALEARGAIPGDLQDRAIWVNEGRPLTRTRSGLRALMTSRLLIEDEIRDRVTALANVVVHERADALGLTFDADGRVRGVRVGWRDRDGLAELLHADLVVDASGRGSRTPAWLQAAGVPQPQVDEIVMGLTYTTREFVRTEPDDEMQNIIIAATVDRPRAGVMLAQPDSRWVVTIGGYLGDAAPPDLDGFRAFAESLPSPELGKALVGLTPVGEPRTFRYHASTWRRYDRMRSFPEGLLVFGDAICSFNPIFGQGMTVAAREALALQRCLAAGDDAGLARRFFAATAREIAIPWEIAASSDLRMPAVTGRRTLKIRLTNRYLPHYFRAAEHDDALGLAFLSVVNLLARPESLLTPARLARVGSTLRRHRDATTVRRQVPGGGSRSSDGAPRNRHR
jgi:2-polyprenyl-6-methoxyphenol hydroxylase-like FAD-dependent oxidoreductase